MIEELILADTADLIMSSDWLVIALWGRMDGWTDIQTDNKYTSWAPFGKNGYDTSRPPPHNQHQDKN